MSDIRAEVIALKAAIKDMKKAVKRLEAMRPHIEQASLPVADWAKLYAREFKQ